MLILSLVAIGIFHSGLGFANAPQPRESGSSSAGEGRMNILQLVFSAGEEMVAGVRQRLIWLGYLGSPLRWGTG
jgi:hypothetical protein